MTRAANDHRAWGRLSAQLSPFRGAIVLACGHRWLGETNTRAEAEEFMALCVATGDTAECKPCGSPQRVTGPMEVFGG